MNADAFRRIALGLMNVVEGAHMGHPDFRVRNRIFATIHPDPTTAMVKLTPEQQQHVVQEHPASFAPENGAWGRSGCTRVQLASVDEAVLGEAMTLAWQNTAERVAARPARRRQASRRPPPRSARKR